MTNRIDPMTAIAGLRLAVPYLRAFKNRTFVIKAGGDVFQDPASTHSFLDQIGVLHQLGMRVVLVHGGGPQTTDLSERLGVEVKMVAGRRVTDEATLEASTMALNGTVNTRIVGAFRKVGVPAIGLSGVDGNLVRARRRQPTKSDGGETISWGHVGDIDLIDTTLLESLLKMPAVPVVSPLSADPDGNLLNINADSVASRLAVALQAEKLIFLSKPRGILEDPNEPASLVSYVDLEGLEKLSQKGSLQGGMLPKTAAIRDAINGGVSRVHVISSQVPNSLLVEIFTNEGSGTLIVRETAQLRAEEAEAGKH